MLTNRYEGEGKRMIQGINNFQPIDYNSISKVSEQHRAGAKLTLADQNSDIEVKQQASEEKKLDLRLGDIRPRQNANLEDIKLSLNESSAFEMKGRESDIESLDIEKAVSDMQKDQALMQYQYFVGDTNVPDPADGIVIAK